MKANEALNLLHIKREGLQVNATNEKIRTIMPNNYYYYNGFAYKLLDNSIDRKIAIYARSTSMQRTALENQLKQLKQWCFMNGYTNNALCPDVSLRLFDMIKGFFEMFDEINYKVGQLVMAYNKLNIVDFELFKDLFQKFGRDFVISEIGNPKLAEGVFGEMISMIHCYSMNKYSNGMNHSIGYAMKAFMAEKICIGCNDVDNIIREAFYKGFANEICNGLYLRSLSYPGFIGMLTSKGGGLYG